jgi:hypothetical protein
VLGAIVRGVTQVVILGAGYDGRALRFPTPGVRFFEVDHPATQADKRDRLALLDVVTEGISFIAADFTEPGLDQRLADAGDAVLTVPSRDAAIEWLSDAGRVSRSVVDLEQRPSRLLIRATR